MRLNDVFKQNFIAQIILAFCLVLDSGRRGGSWLERSTPEWVVRVRALAIGTLCCVLGQDTSLSRYLSPTCPYDLLKDRRTIDVIITKSFPLHSLSNCR